MIHTHSDTHTAYDTHTQCIIHKVRSVTQKLGNKKVNLERSMTALSEIGGHLVSGHIHTTGVVKALAVNGGAIDLRIELPKQFMQYIFYKGYVGLNGCSLTIGKVFKASFDIHLIPETLKISTFGSIGKGDLINIEIDQATINTVETVKKFMLEKKLK